MLQWLEDHDTLLWFLGAASVLMFFATLIGTPFMVARLPEDYFDPSHPHSIFEGELSPLRITLRILKNIIGVVVLLAGIAMLVLPGQGILTIILGLILINFPGRHRLVCSLAHRPHMSRSLNWIRGKMKRRPFIFVFEHREKRM